MLKFKTIKSAVFIVATILLLLSLTGLAVLTVKGQSQATVTILTSIGGTTTPAAGTSTYADGSVVSLLASPDAGYTFAYWMVANDTGSTTYTDNPLSLTVSGGVNYTVQPVFYAINAQVPLLTNPSVSANSGMAIVVVVGAVGGTTNPPPGVYTLANAASLSLTAIPNSGWKFDNWVIGGYPLSHGSYSFTDTPTDNPYNVNHGYGNTYDYQPVFSPVSTTPEYPVAAAVTLAAMLAATALGTYAYKKIRK